MPADSRSWENTMSATTFSPPPACSTPCSPARLPGEWNLPPECRAKRKYALCRRPAASRAKSTSRRLATSSCRQSSWAVWRSAITTVTRASMKYLPTSSRATTARWPKRCATDSPHATRLPMTKSQATSGQAAAPAAAQPPVRLPRPVPTSRSSAAAATDLPTSPAWMTSRRCCANASSSSSRTRN